MVMRNVPDEHYHKKNGGTRCLYILKIAMRYLLERSSYMIVKTLV